MTRHCLNQCWSSSETFLGINELTQWGRVTHICISKLTIIGSDNGLLVPSHYLNQCRDIVNWSLTNKLQWNCNWNSYICIQENPFGNVVWKIASILSRPHVLIYTNCNRGISGFLLRTHFRMITCINTASKGDKTLINRGIQYDAHKSIKYINSRQIVISEINNISDQ